MCLNRSFFFFFQKRVMFGKFAKKTLKKALKEMDMTKLKILKDVSFFINAEGNAVHLGTGTYGSVFAGMRKGKPVAVKVIILV